MKVIVIGGGPAGMMAAITAKQMGHDVTLIEKNRNLGKKLLITGKGRCNITSSLNINEFISNVPGNGKFLYSAFNNFTNEDIINLMKEEGVEVKVERGNRIFPVSDKSLDVLKVFTKKMKELDVNIILNDEVKEIVSENNAIKGVILKQEGFVEAERVILATGGKSYPATGSNGDGYELVKKLGHTITKIRPSLVPLCARNNSLKICRDLQGLSLRNVEIKFEDIENKKIIYSDFGEMIFTHFGVSGPTILSGSAHLLRYKNIDKLLKNNKVVLKIDLKPALSFEKLNLRILRDFKEDKNKTIKNCLEKLLPKKMIPVVLNIAKIDENKLVNEITREERNAIINTVKEFKITISDFRPIDEAIVTSGGVSIKEINPKTMESKFIEGLFFAGEVIDVDAYTGGFNLQIAYSTGYTAGINLY